MSFYLFDFFVNNLNLFLCVTMIFKLGEFNKEDFINILCVDIFINRIPIVFFSIFFLNLLNRWIKNKFVNSFILDNLLFLLNYLLFFIVIFIYRNYEISILHLFKYLYSNIIINYLLFFLYKFSSFKVLKNIKV